MTILWIAISLVLVGFFFPTTCAPCCNDCGYCTKGTAHATYQIDISGVVNGSCSDCAGLNGTFVLSQCNSSLTGASQCAWEYHLSSPLCFSGGLFTADYYTMEVHNSDHLQVIVGPTYNAGSTPPGTCHRNPGDLIHGYYRYDGTFETLESCDFPGTDIPILTGHGSGRCDLETSTCTLTGL